MPDEINFVPQREHTLQVENLSLKLLVDLVLGKPLQISDLSTHTHSLAEIFTCSKGSVLIRTPQQMITLLPGDAAIIPSGFPHNKMPDTPEESHWNAITVICTECPRKNARDVYSRIAPLTIGEEPHIFRACPAFCSTVERICRITENENDFAHMLSFFSAFYELTDISERAAKKAGDPSRHSAKNIDRLVKLDYLISSKFMDHFDNRQIAAELFLSERQLARLVKQHYGATLHSLIINRRIEVAAKMLTETAYSVENIGLMVGFKSKAGFYQKFEKVYAMTPAEYRAKQRS